MPSAPPGLLSPAQIIQQEFDHTAKGYETNRLAGWYKAHAELLADELATTPQDGTILDIGCGTGYLLRLLARQRPDLTGIGLDLSGEMIRLARDLASQENLTGLRFVQANWESNQFATLREEITTRSLTTIVCANTFHYFQNPLIALRRIADLLPPGGRFLLLDRAKEDSLLTSIWGLLHTYMIKDQVRFYQSSEIESLLAAAGFVQTSPPRIIRRFFWRGKAHTSIAIFSCLR